MTRTAIKEKKDLTGPKILADFSEIQLNKNQVYFNGGHSADLLAKSIPHNPNNIRLVRNESNVETILVFTLIELTKSVKEDKELAKTALSNLVSELGQVLQIIKTAFYLKEVYAQTEVQPKVKDMLDRNIPRLIIIYSFICQFMRSIKKIIIDNDSEFEPTLKALNAYENTLSETFNIKRQSGKRINLDQIRAIKA